MRRSISLSPIRTESGANLRTANWTRLKFRAPHQQQQQHYRNYNNNYGNYQNYHNRGYHNQRFQNRGRGYYRNQNFTTTRYIPKRRYSSNRRDESRSRSRSYSRSISRDRSHSRHKDSRSRSRSFSDDQRSDSRDRDRSRSYSPEPKEIKERRNKASVKTEAAAYYSSAQPAKAEMEFPEKVATDLSRWGSPGVSTFQSSSNKKMQEALAKSVDAEEVQEKMKKTALESVARHEKSLHKFKLAQSKKLDSDSELSDGAFAPKKKKKSKKKKIKVAKVTKKKQKPQKVKVIEMSDSGSSNSDSSDDNSSDDDSSSSSPPPKKSKSSMKRKKSAAKEDGQNAKAALPQQPAFFYPPGAASQPMMMMAPNMGGGDMKFLNPYGQPMNVMKIEMPGPDGKMMQFLQFPSMPQGAMQPVVMAQPVPAVQPQPQQISQPARKPQPVAPPVVSAKQPAVSTTPAVVEQPMSSHLKVVPIQDDSVEASQNNSQESKELSEKQKRRKEVIRTRLWPRPANTAWSVNDNDDKPEEDMETDGNQNPDSQSANDLPTKNVDGNANATEHGDDYIPGLSPNLQNKSDNAEVQQGQKIPTLGGAADQFANTTSTDAEAEAVVVEEEEVIEEVSYSQETTTPMVQAPVVTPAVNPAGIVAYPQIVQGFKPVFSNPTVPTIVPQDNQSSMAGPMDGGQAQWQAPANEYLQHEDKFQPSSDGECSSSSDDAERYMKSRRWNEGKRSQKSKGASGKDKGEEEIKKGKKKKKTKKERKISVGSEEVSSPVMKDKKKKKKKKTKVKEVDDFSEIDTKSKGLDKTHFEQVSEKKKKKDGLERDIPQELPLAHIRGLVLRKPDEGGRSIFSHIEFAKTKKSAKSLREVHDTYEDQFVSLFHEEVAEPAETPLTMSRSSLKKIKIKPQGTRSVTHMTKIPLCERISHRPGEKGKAVDDKNPSQKVSVNLASLSSVQRKFDKPKPRSVTKSPSRSSRSPSKSLSRSSKSPSKSRSPRRYRSRSMSRSSYSSRSRSRSKSLPKAYTVDDRARDDDRRMYKRDGGNRYYNPHYQQHNQQFRYNPNFRYQRGRGNYNNYYNNRGNRGNYYNNRGYNNNNNRGYFNRNRGYYNNNNNRDRQQWRPNYNNRDRRDSDRGDRSFERRSYTRSPERGRASSYSSDMSDRRDKSVERNDYKADMKEVDARELIENKQVKLQKSPGQWTHDKYEEQEPDDVKAD